MSLYNWQQKDWPNFTYHLDGLEDELFSIAEKVGRVTGMWQALPDKTQQEAIINFMVAEAVKTSKIEGEFLNRSDVLSSIRKNLGLSYDTEKIKDKRAVGIAELMLDVRNSYAEPLNEEKLFSWHKMLFKNKKSIEVGGWRTHIEPMQVVSGALGKEKVHYEAPPSSQVAQEMQYFIEWFNSTAPKEKKELKYAPIRSAIAHLYFVTIHPFEDGNGRIGRSIAEKAMSQGIGRPALFSLSDTIESNKRQYYDSLKVAQRTNHITEWIHYFVKCVSDAQTRAEELIVFTLKKVKFFDRYTNLFNDRQLKVVNRMLDAGPSGFEGGMNAGKYIGITRTSKATATRDIQQLVELGALKRLGDSGGRSTRYEINL